MTRLLLLLIALLIAMPAWPHKPSDSYLHLAVDGNETLELRWDVGLNDLVRAIDLDTDGDGRLSWGELEGQADAIHSAAAGWLLIDPAAACTMRQGPLALTRHAGELYAVIAWAGSCARAPATLEYRFRFDLDPDHRVFASVQSAAGEFASVLAPANRVLRVSSLDAFQAFREFTWHGMTHIWQGYDHLAFLLLLVIPVFRAAGTRLRPVAIALVKIVTAFTLAHSVTLTAAALGYVALNPVLIEVLIAASVVVAALLVWMPRAAGAAIWLALGFGLLHGFGFANALTDLVAGEGSPLVPLASFNLGVELGQLLVVILVAPVLWLLRGRRIYRFGLMPATSIAAVAIATLWLVERLPGLQANSGAYSVTVPEETTSPAALRTTVTGQGQSLRECQVRQRHGLAERKHFVERKSKDCAPDTDAILTRLHEHDVERVAARTTVLRPHGKLASRLAVRRNHLRTQPVLKR